jgi:hypothetical protein
MLRQGQDPAESETWLRLDDGSRMDQAASSTPLDKWIHQFMCM